MSFAPAFHANIHQSRIETRRLPAPRSRQLRQLLCEDGLATFRVVAEKPASQKQQDQRHSRPWQIRNLARIAPMNTLGVCSAFWTRCRGAHATNTEFDFGWRDAQKADGHLA